MADEQELFLQVADAVRAVLNTEEGEITRESLFRTDLGAESIDFLDISFEVEKRTGIELNFQSALQYITEKKGPNVTDLSVADLVDYLQHAKGT
jgi:acyl carrier protein